MPNRVKTILDNFINEIKIMLGDRLKKVILYGSYARGDFNNESDIDVLILTDLNNKEISEYTNKIWEICADIEIDKEIIISPIVRNIDEFNLWNEAKPIYINILNEGVVLVGEKE